MSAGSTPSWPFTTAAAPLIEASAPIRSRDNGSPEISKFCTARCVCAPHNASAGTATSPIESWSMRKSSGAPAMTASRSARSRPDRQQRLASRGDVRTVLARGTTPGTPEKVVALVIYHDERREVPDLDPPYGLHAEFGVLQHIDLGDAVLGELGRRAADRPEVEAAVLEASLG